MSLLACFLLLDPAYMLQFFFVCVYLSLQISGSIGSFVDGNKRSNTSREGPTKKWCAHKMGDYKDGS